MRRRQLLPWLLAPLLLGAGVVAASRLWVEWHWFEQFGWGPVLLRRLGLQMALLLAGLGLGLVLQRWLEHFWRLGRSTPAPRRFALEPLPYALALLGLVAAQLLPLLLLLQLAQRLLLEPFDTRRLHGLALLLDGSLPGRIALLSALVVAAVALLWRPQPVARTLAAAGSEFGLVADEVAYGAELTTSLMDMADRWDLPDIRMFAVSISLQSETGGNLAEILGNLSSVIRDRHSMYLKVRALSSEGRMSGWVLSALPVLTFLFLFTLNRKFFFDVAGDPIFLYGFTGLGLLYAVGVYTIRRMIDLKV